MKHVYIDNQFNIITNVSLNKGTHGNISERTFGHHTHIYGDVIGKVRFTDDSLGDVEKRYLLGKHTYHAEYEEKFPYAELEFWRVPYPEEEAVIVQPEYRMNDYGMWPVCKGIAVVKSNMWKGRTKNYLHLRALDDREIAVLEIPEDVQYDGDELLTYTDKYGRKVAA